MAWNIDYEHDSEEIILLKRHIADQDNRYSALQSQMIKTKSALDDNKAALDETTGKLRVEADRALRLDEELRECRENLDKEKLMRQNGVLALRSAAERGKQDEITRRELQQTVESIASRDTTSNTVISSLRNEKAALERRMWELESNLQQVITAATPKRKGRARSSSLSDIRISALERDLGESQASMTELRVALERAQEKLRRTEDDLVRVQNDKAALERRTAEEIRSLQGIIASKDEEIVHSSGGEDARLAQEREEELIRRVEEEEAKVFALERLISETPDVKAVEGALQKAERRLAAEISKAKGLEEKNAGLNRDVKRVRDALEDLRSQAQGLKAALDESSALVHALQTQERALTAQLNSQQEKIRSLKDAESSVRTANATSENGAGATNDVETIEKLLAAVERLRCERDELRRQLEFLQVESRFAIEALKRKIDSGATPAAPVAEDPRISQLQGEVQELLERLARTNLRMRTDVPLSAIDSPRLGLIASASLVMVGHLQTRVDHDIELRDQCRMEISHLRSQLQDAAVSRDESHDIQQSLLDVQHHLHDTEQQRDDLLLQVEHLQSQAAASARIREQYRELQSNLEDTTARLSDFTKALEDAESERNSFKVEAVNLQDEMASAREELKLTEQRYRDLQNEQLSSIPSTQINRKLKEQIQELEDRVERRTEQIGIHQHDIKRLEANLRLQEDRIAEMTGELEVAMSEKESMVEDCADAREARDTALKKAEDLEDAVATLEAQLQALEGQRDTEVTTLVKVWSSTLAQSRSSTTRLRAVAYQMDAANTDMAQRLQHVSAEHNYAAALLNEQASALKLAHEEATSHREDAREAVVALAVVRKASSESQRSMLHDREQICALLSATRDELNNRFEEINALQDQLRRMRSQEDAKGTEQQSGHLEEVAKLQQAITDLDRLRAELQDELAQYRKELGLAVEQRDQLRTDNVAIKAQITQLQSDHVEELESLRGKLQQVAVDLQEAREAHAAAQKACSELSATNAELESRLENVTQQQDTDSELIAELQSRDAAHTKQMLDVQSRLDDCTEELQKTIREKSELDILLQQTRSEISKAKGATEAQVSDLLTERDALQQRVDEVESRRAKEAAEVRERLEGLEDKVHTLQDQLDKAITEKGRIRATFEKELRGSEERHEESRAQLDDVKAQLSALGATFESVLEEKDAIEAKNTNLESEIQRAYSMQRYLESQLKDSAHESAAVKAEFEQMKEKCAHAEREGKAAEIQLTFTAAQHDQTIASLKREIQLLQAATMPDERVQELEEKISYMDELMRSKTQEIEENDDRFIELHKERKKLTAKVETLNRKVQTLQSKLATLKDVVANQNLAQPTASTSKQKSPVPQHPAVVAPAQYTKSSPSTYAAPSTPPSRSRAKSGPSTLLGRKTPENRRRSSSIFRAKTPEHAKASTSKLQDPIVPTSIVAGKKRAAPDDADEPVPAQGFTSEGVLATTARSTPRRRKSPRTGFTPVRNTTARPVTMLALEPAQVAPGAAAAAPPVISDVTNSPRGRGQSQAQTQADVKVKRGWLGTHRSKPAQSSGSSYGTTRTNSGARPGAALADSRRVS